MTEQQILEQSKAAYAQWAVQWREHAKINSSFQMKPLENFRDSGIGKAILCVANGYSLEENLETIQANKEKIDILCCDKTLGHLLNAGIVPKFCMVCDANVNYELYLESYKDRLQNTTLFMNVCGNPDWAKKANWKDVYFFVNKDIMKNEVEFSELSGCKNFIPAATNVSNAMVVLLTQCDNNLKQNFFNYDKILLIGYDYSWRYGKKYYAFDEDGAGKNMYMRHIFLMTHAGSWAYTSGNLLFSARWLDQYIRNFKLPIIQCTKESIFTGLKFGKLEEQLAYEYKSNDAKDMTMFKQQYGLALKVLSDLQNKIRNIELDHAKQFIVST